MIIASIIEGAPLHGVIGLASLITASIILTIWLETKHTLQMAQWLLLGLIAFLNLTEYGRLEYFVGVDVDPLLPTSTGKTAFSTYDSNLYWHHIIWFLTPILFLGVILSNLALIIIIRKDSKSL